MINTIGIEKAMLYEKYRLPYAREVVDNLLERIGDVRLIADIGAGTGQLARLFSDRGMKIYVVEPDPSMREMASHSLKDLASIEIIDGYAEQTTLTENSIDLIVVGNAFHRFKPEACEEFRRILRKDGWIALFTYSFLNRAFTELLFSKLAALEGLPARMERSWKRTPVERLFGDGPIQRLRYRQFHRENWTAFFGAACSGIEAPTRRDQEFSQFEAINREVFDTFAMNGIIQIEYETQVMYGQPKFQLLKVSKVEDSDKG